tara:strand:- start:168 stop:314 length:147 start_codon:yes stop_codon:yes gene_type:complete
LTSDKPDDSSGLSLLSVQFCRQPGWISIVDLGKNEKAEASCEALGFNP